MRTTNAVVRFRDALQVGCVAKRSALSRRWDRSATIATTRCAKVSTPLECEIRTTEFDRNAKSPENESIAWRICVGIVITIQRSARIHRDQVRKSTHVPRERSHRLAAHAESRSSTRVHHARRRCVLVCSQLVRARR